MSAGPVNVKLSVEGSSLSAIFDAASSLLQDVLEAEMIEILIKQGWSVERPGGWETPGEICARLGISANKFCYRIKDPMCPKPYAVIRTRDERCIRHLRSHSVLDKFLSNTRPQSAWREKNHEPETQNG